jgi:hypothetical protein
MYDNVLVLDDPEALCCPEGHPLRSLQTKDFEEPSLATYLLSGGRLYCAIGTGTRSSRGTETERWHVSGTRAVRESCYELREVPGPRRIRVCDLCEECAPVLVRTDHRRYPGDLVSEHPIFVDFTLTFRPGEPLQIERTTGTREAFKRDLAARGLYVLEDNEPLAIAHRELARWSRG